MASSQDQRYQERLARQRGAGTHKITNVGFSIQPLGRPLIPASTVPSHLPQPQLKPPSPPPLPETSTSKALTSKPVTPIQELSPVRSDHFISQNSPEIDTAALIWKRTRPSPFHEGTTTSLSPLTLKPPETTILAARRTSLRGFGTPSITQPSSNVSSVSQIDTPTSHVLVSRISTRPAGGGVSVAAAVTPVTKEKSMTQSSPGVPLEVSGIGGIDGGVGRGRSSLMEDGSMIGMEEEDAVREEEVEEEEEDGVREERKGSDEAVTMGVDDVIMGLGERIEGAIEEMKDAIVLGAEEKFENPIIAVKSPENWNKRRKVILHEPELKETPSEWVGGSVAQEQEAEAVGLERKRQIVEKRPISPQVTGDDDDDDDDEGEGEGGDEIAKDILEIEEHQGPTELGELVEGRGGPSQNPPKPPKSSKNPQPKLRLKPQERTQRPENQDGDEEPASTFPVIIHRLRKSHGSILPVGSQRSGINPIDVINQVSMEIIDKYFFRAESGSQRKAVENFKEELGLRFLELTDVLENNIILTARARQTQKRRTQLAAELLGIKQKREHIAVKMDGVRKAHELATKGGEDQQYISDAFEDILGTLERGKARQPEGGETGTDGLEALARKVSVAVTGGGSDGTGLLATAIEFNKFLERAEKALSGRRRL